MSGIDSLQLAAEMGTFLGVEHVRPPQGRESGGADLIIEPGGPDEIAEVVRKCRAQRLTLAAVGSARTLSEIRSAPVNIGVSLRRMNRILAYEPDDMTIVAEAGITLGALNRHVALRGQRLPADPPQPDLTTLGALIAAAKAGPIRHSEGTVRDLLIGIRFIGHGGRAVHGGGRVVKNVAGYDLMKVMTGSFGTLGIVTEATFKVRPNPANYMMAVAYFDRCGQAFDAAAQLNDSLPLVHLELLSPALSRAFGAVGKYAAVAGAGGNRGEVDHIRTRMREIIGTGMEVFEAGEAVAAYERLRDLDCAEAPLAAQLAVAPAELMRCLGEFGADFRAHAGCGVAQIYGTHQASAGEAAQSVARWRDAVRRSRGHLRILRADAALRSGLAMFDDPPAPALNLMRRMKATFDPDGIFNPGCFVGGL
jgi:glycolate dehydrogenase FAD-binding subunit